METENAKTLCEIAQANGTDKVAVDHVFAGRNYAERYDEICNPFRFKPVRVLEIGVLHGASLRSWCDYFPRGDIHGIDIDENVRRAVVHPRVTIHIGSQADSKFLNRRVSGPFDFIVDDGSHITDHILASFRTLFPRVVPGGWYCIEDLRNTHLDLDSTYDVRQSWPGMHKNEDAVGAFDCHRHSLDAWIINMIKNMDFHTGEIEEIRVSAMMIFIRKRRDLPPLRLDLRPTIPDCVFVVSFSLYGNKAVYVRGAIENARQIHKKLPGWRARFFVGSDVPQHALCELADVGNHVEIIPMNKTDDLDRRGSAMLWRFAPAVDPGVDAFISRDADSRISKREITALEEWFGSGRVFHGMRDATDHNYPILGGMWGIMPRRFLGLEPELVAQLHEEIQTGKLKPQHATDQAWLEERLWPAVSRSGVSIVHDSQPKRNFSVGDVSVLFSTDIDPSEGFVGQCFDPADERPITHDKRVSLESIVFE